VAVLGFRKKPTKFVFVFGVENGLFGHFRLFSFSAENEVYFLFYCWFSFQKCHLYWAENIMFATEPKLSFCDIGTGDFRFGRKWNFIFVGIFVYGQK